MYCRLLLLLIAWIFTVAFASAESFETDIAPILKYSETYDDTIVLIPEYDDYEVIPRTTLKVTATCSMKGVDLSSIDEATTVSIDFEGLFEEWTLGDDPAYKKGDTSATIPLWGMDPVTWEDKRVGKVSVVWNATAVTITLTAEDDPDSFQVMAQDRVFDGEANSSYSESVLVTVGFGDRELSERTAYIQGTISYKDYEKGDISESLIRVSLSGGIDSSGPTLQMLNPPAGAEIRDTTSVISGTVSDEHGVAAVSVKVNEGEEVPATVDMQGNWSLPVTFVPGTNTIVAKATDQDGNTTTLKARTVTFFSVSNLTVRAEGEAGGQVVSNFFAPLLYSPGSPSPERITSQDEGATLTVTALPAAGAIFDRWISNYPLTNETSSKLQFTMHADMHLTARFAQNVFLPVRGKYTGLLSSSDAAGRGFLTVQLARDGSFTGSIRTGSATVRLKGKFMADGTYEGSVKAGKQLFDLSLSLAASESGARQITGTFQSRGGSSAPVLSAITADLGVFKKKVRAIPAQWTGGYNVLLTPDSGNTEADFPVGIGFGRVTLSRYGTAKFVGKLGDGTPAAASGSVSEDGFWPMYVPLYRQKGGITGRVQFDLLQPTSDLSGSLEWSRPATRGRVHPEGFAGTVQLMGAKYVRPAKGQRIFLNPSGVGLLSVDAPESGADLPALHLDSDVSLSSANQLAVANTALDVKATFKVATGLFSGSFLDVTQSGRRVKFGGVVVVGGSADLPKGNVAGGLFIRGDRTGAIQLTAPVPESPEQP